MTTLQKMSKPKRLSPEQIATLESHGCIARNWESVLISPDSDLSLFRNVEFEGDVEIGCINRLMYPRSIITNALLRDCRIADGVRIRNVGEISGVSVGQNAVIENCFRISKEKGASCGIGTRVGVLDETGAREVIIYPELNAQQAIMMARVRRSIAENIYHRTSAYCSKLIDSFDSDNACDLEEGAEILNCGMLKNVRTFGKVRIEGARSLINGCVISSIKASGSESLTFIGSGVDAENFIIEDGIVDSGALLRNCYVGQGVRLEKGFTAHDSLFFANCSMENGEACALFAGPYTVSMHKGTLLIGCQTSFMNAGSSTNQSNHMYKLGPIHWGVLERGVKTSSGSYLMLGANIGAFSLLMGSHKTHPDSREFPFSYLFGDPQGATVVVPAVMLRSCGLMRDEQKWPARDRRAALPADSLRDRITFPILNPVTVEAMIEAIEIIRPMLHRPADDDRYQRYKGMKLSKASLERAIKLYHLGILKYLAGIFFPDYQENSESEMLSRWSFPAPPVDAEEAERDAEKWMDLAGQIVRRSAFTKAAEASTLEESEEILNKAFADYAEDERRWIAARFPQNLRFSGADILRGAEEFDRLVEQDRETYRETLSAELAMLRL